MAKRRLDELLVARGLVASVEDARRACLAGEVTTSDRLLTQAGASLDETTPLTIKPTLRYVSRGGEKLAGALHDFAFDPSGLRCIDIGASTGGFTDCLLQAGARQVTAVDVGYGQFAWSLRTDERVVLFERTNIRSLSPTCVGAPFDVAVCDLSFIGLAHLLPLIRSFLQSPGGTLLALVKPQFELPAAQVGAGGVVTDEAAHVQALESVLVAAYASGLVPRGLVPSRLKGPKGNVEFFFWAQEGGIPATIDTEAVVAAAGKII